MQNDHFSMKVKKKTQKIRAKYEKKLLDNEDFFSNIDVNKKNPKNQENDTMLRTMAKFNFKNM